MALTQEVQIILTLEVDITKNKEDIKKFFEDMEQTYTRTVSARNRWEFSKISNIQVKEEAEIYNNELICPFCSSTNTDIINSVSECECSTCNKPFEA